MNIKNFLKKGVIAFMFLVLVAGFSYSQATTGKLAGMVTDEEGAPLPGVSIEVSSISLMGLRGELTTAKGGYRFITLPPGSYKVVFSLEGFKTVERPNVRVSLGGTTTVDATLELATLAEEVTVIAEAPLVDVEQSGIASTFTSDDILKLPVPRGSIGAVLEMNPGVQGQNAFGSDEMDNNNTIDGLPTSSPEGGGFRMSPDVDTVEEVEMITIGASAEYGQVAGSVVNIVTKSGGNKLEGSVAVYIRPNFLLGDNNPLPDVQSPEYQRYYDASFSLSGAVAQDRIWFFLYGNRQERIEVRFGGDPENPRERSKWAGNLKVTGQIGTRHKVSMNIMQAITNNLFVYPGEYVTSECQFFSYFVKPGYFANWDWQLSRNALYSMKAGYWSNPEKTGDPAPGVGANLLRPVHFDDMTDIMSGSTYYFWWWNNARFQWNNSLSYYAQDFIGGDHDFKVGVQFERGLSHTAGGYPGDAQYNDRNNQPWRVIQREPHHYGGYITAIGGFVDDTIKVGDRLTLNVGVRADNSKGSIPSWPLMRGGEDIPGTAAPGIPDVLNLTTVSPRLGFTYQLTADRKTILKAHWGLYHPMVHNKNFGGPGPGKRDTYCYEYIGPPVPILPFHSDDLFRWFTTNPQDDPDNWVETDFIAGGAAFTMDPDYKNPVSSQFTAGLERELLPDFSIGVTYVHKKEWNLLGLEDRGAIYEEVEMVSPDDGKTYTVWNHVGGEHDIWQVNPEEYGLTYNSVILVLDKRYSNNWMLKASLMWQKAEGLNMDFPSGTYQSTWYNDFGQDPNDLVNGAGPLGGIRDWIGKIQAGFTLPYDFSIGANYTYYSGMFHVTWVGIEGLNQGYRRIADKPLGDRRLDPTHTLDIRVEKRFNFDPISLTLIADIFNAINYQSPRMKSYWLGSDSYLQTRSVNDPRRMQVGLKLTF